MVEAFSVLFYGSVEVGRSVADDFLFFFTAEVYCSSEAHRLFVVFIFSDDADDFKSSGAVEE